MEKGGLPDNRTAQDRAGWLFEIIDEGGANLAAARAVMTRLAEFYNEEEDHAQKREYRAMHDMADRLFGFIHGERWTTEGEIR